MLTLAQYLEHQKLRQAVFAERVGKTQATISRIVNGDAQPSLDLALSIQRETGGRVPVWSWAAFAALKPNGASSDVPARAAE